MYKCVRKLVSTQANYMVLPENLTVAECHVYLCWVEPRAYKWGRGHASHVYTRYYGTTKFKSADRIC